MNGKVISEIEHPKPDSYSNVKVYAAGNYLRPSDAWIRNLQASTSNDSSKAATVPSVTADIEVGTLPTVTGVVEVITLPVNDPTSTTRRPTIPVTAPPPGAQIGVATLPPARPAHCTPGVCREFANYYGDPGGYDKRHSNIRRVGACRRLCRRDANCCHWVHYGRKGETLIKVKYN